MYKNFDDFDKKLSASANTLYVINFWATWCGPCVKELPYFDELHDISADLDIEVVLVSLDFADQAERIKSFVQSKGIRARVIHLQDPQTQVWIDKVDPAWSGSLPATQLRLGATRHFKEDSFPDLKSLRAFVEDFSTKIRE